MKNKIIILSVSGIITVIITSVMNLWLLPAIEFGTVGMRFFDMNPLGYSYDVCQSFIASLSTEEINLALHVQLPLDFVYPVVYSVFFILAFNLLTGKRSVSVILPVLLFVSDYTENICSIIMLKTDTLSKNLVCFASTVTIIKNILMYLIFILLAVLFIRFLYIRLKRKKQ